MRLTKKFKGDKSLTKCGFKPCKQTPELLEEAQCVRAALADQERRLASSQPLQKGKMTIEEEELAEATIRAFERGMLSCPPGTTLRQYAARAGSRRGSR